MPKPRIFVSSTFYDLKYLRSSLEQFIESLKKEDYLKFVSPRLRKKLLVIEKDFLWKRKFRLSNLLDKDLKDEYWLVTNR